MSAHATAVAGKNYEIGHGDVVIAAITSCTNTSNPYVMVGAGLVARKARERGLTPKPWVKTSLAPGSQVVTEYLEKSGLDKDLDALGFNLVGYGCTTCIGNSGPLEDAIADAIEDNKLVAVSVLSGNRNFEGRVHPNVRANYLASPPLVVAYALLGTMNEDITTVRSAPARTASRSICATSGRPPRKSPISCMPASTATSSSAATARSSPAPRNGRRSRSTPAATPMAGPTAPPT